MWIFGLHCESPVTLSKAVRLLYSDCTVFSHYVFPFHFLMCFYLLPTDLSSLLSRLKKRIAIKRYWIISAVLNSKWEEWSDGKGDGEKRANRRDTACKQNTSLWHLGWYVTLTFNPQWHLNLKAIDHWSAINLSVGCRLHCHHEGRNCSLKPRDSLAEKLWGFDIFIKGNVSTFLHVKMFFNSFLTDACEQIVT